MYKKKNKNKKARPLKKQLLKKKCRYEPLGIK